MKWCNPAVKRKRPPEHNWLPVPPTAVRLRLRDPTKSTILGSNRNGRPNCLTKTRCRLVRPRALPGPDAIGSAHPSQIATGIVLQRLRGGVRHPVGSVPGASTPGTTPSPLTRSVAHSNHVPGIVVVHGVRTDVSLARSGQGCWNGSWAPFHVPLASCFKLA